MIPRDAPVSVIAARYASSATGDGTLVAEYDYDPYGRLIRETGPQAATCPFRYSTKWYDPDLGLLYYGHRWYDAASLKWLTPDPIGERGGANLTAFCDGDPVNNVDPLGLEGQSADGFTIPYRSPMGRFFLPAHTAMLGDWSREERQMLLDYAEETGPAKRDAAVALNVAALSCMAAPALFVGGGSTAAIPVAAPAPASAGGGSATPLIFHWFHQSRWMGPMVRVGTAVGAGMGLRAIKAPEAPIQVHTPAFPATRRQTTVLGENMEGRVIPFAKEIGARTLPWAGTPEQWRAWSPQQRYRANDRMLRIRAREGDLFATIGADARRPEALRRRFDLTRAELMRLEYMRISVEERSAINVYLVLGDPLEVLGRGAGE